MLAPQTPSKRSVRKPLQSDNARSLNVLTNVPSNAIQRKPRPLALPDLQLPDFHFSPGEDDNFPAPPVTPPKKPKKKTPRAMQANLEDEEEYAPSTKKKKLHHNPTHATTTIPVGM